MKEDSKPREKDKDKGKAKENGGNRHREGERERAKARARPDSERQKDRGNRERDRDSEREKETERKSEGVKEKERLRDRDRERDRDKGKDRDRRRVKNGEHSRDLDREKNREHDKPEKKVQSPENLTFCLARVCGGLKHDFYLSYNVTRKLVFFYAYLKLRQSWILNRNPKRCLFLVSCVLGFFGSSLNRSLLFSQSFIKVLFSEFLTISYLMSREMSAGL